MDAATLNTVTMPAPLAEANKDSAPPEVVVTKKAKVDEKTASPTKVENVAPPTATEEPPKGEAPIEPAPVEDVPMDRVEGEDVPELALDVGADARHRGARRGNCWAESPARPWVFGA